jgi:hypothetical protein
MTVMAEPEAQYLLGGKYTVEFRAFGGSALCDWTAESAWDKEFYRPVQVVIAFTGNDLSDCAAHAYAAGGEPGLVANYCSTLKQMHTNFAGVPMSVLAAPASRPATSATPPPSTVTRDSTRCTSSFAVSWACTTTPGPTTP